MAPPAPSRAYGSNHLAHYDLRAERVLTIPYTGWCERACPGVIPALTSLRQARVVLSCQAPYTEKKQTIGKRLEKSHTARREVRRGE